MILKYFNVLILNLRGPRGREREKEREEESEGGKDGGERGGKVGRETDHGLLQHKN